MNRKSIIRILIVLVLGASIFAVIQKRNISKLAQAHEAILRNSLAAVQSNVQSSIINSYITSKNKKTTLLHQAIVQKPDDQTAHKILEYIINIEGIDYNQPEKIYQHNQWIDGHKPVHSAVERGNVRAVELLAQKHADLNAVNPFINMTSLAFVENEKNPELRKEWHFDQIEDILRKSSNRNIN